MNLVFDYPALAELGWTPFFQQQFVALSEPSSAPERVVAEQRGEYTLLGAGGERRAVLSGRVRHHSRPDAWPCVGDFVLCDAQDGDPGRIEHVFERATLLARKAPGPSSQAQLIAANVDLVVIVAALSSEEADERVKERGLNPRRLERYLTLVRESGARALVAVNKGDLSEESAALAAGLSDELGRADVVSVSARTGAGVDALLERLGRHESAVLVGSSGVGKSSLTNRLLGQDAQRVNEVREDDARGRHTTTSRQLFRLPTGGFLIDTPGMRELGLVSELDDAAGFDDIEALAEGCRFRDCKHEEEPGCAVQAAVEAGELSAERLESSHKLRRELAWQRSQSDALLQREVTRKRKVLARRVRAAVAEKGRRR
jgi:ribosome biogenesis GTPase